MCMQSVPSINYNPGLFKIAFITLVLSVFATQPALAQQMRYESKLSPGLVKQINIAGLNTKMKFGVTVSGKGIPTVVFQAGI